jgi:hypothetical protein
MVGLSQLWLPILLSGVIVFVASSIVHMVLPWHKGDFKTVPNEDRFREAMRALSIPPGDYMVPRPARREDMKSKAFTDKMKAGPILTMTVLPAGVPSMGTYLVQWFIFCVIVSVFAGYIAGRALPQGTEYLHVFRFAGATAFIAYSVAQWPNSIWYRRSWMITFKQTIDGLIYGMLTAGVFGWLWPR